MNHARPTRLDRLRRRLAAAALAPLLMLGTVQAQTAPAAPPREGVDVGERSVFGKIISSGDLERMAEQQYRQLLQQAQAERTLLPADHPESLRLQAIAQRIIPFTPTWNDRAPAWRWQVHLIDKPTINAFCMPGGKIVFYTGILRELKLSDDEVAMIMGHEMAHALREHAAERMGKGVATSIGTDLLIRALGLGDVGQVLARQGANLLTLKFSRTDETDADLVGMELAARAGFDPRASITLWQKMSRASGGAPPQWLSTHPAHGTRIDTLQANLAKVLPLYERAKAR
jgi:predicted Zn-dependent protease